MPSVSALLDRAIHAGDVFQPASSFCQSYVGANNDGLDGAPLYHGSGSWETTQSHETCQNQCAVQCSADSNEPPKGLKMAQLSPRYYSGAAIYTPGVERVMFPPVEMGSLNGFSRGFAHPNAGVYGSAPGLGASSTGGSYVPDNSLYLRGVAGTWRQAGNLREKGDQTDSLWPLFERQRIDGHNMYDYFAYDPTTGVPVPVVRKGSPDGQLVDKEAINIHTDEHNADPRVFRVARFNPGPSFVPTVY